jgi:hypothetical protein
LSEESPDFWSIRRASSLSSWLNFQEPTIVGFPWGACGRDDCSAREEESGLGRDDWGGVMGPGGAWALDGAGQNIQAAAKVTANRTLVVVLFVLNCISRP